MAKTARWSGVIAVENLLTGDGRLLETDSLRWENLPLPIRTVKEDSGAHDGAVVIGLIETIERREGGEIWGEGSIDLGSAEGQEAFRLIQEGYRRGVSVDLDDTSFEIRIASEIMEEMDSMMEELFEDEDEEESAEEVERETDENGRVTVAKIGSDDEVMVVTSARIRAATLVDIPAFIDAQISVVEEDISEEEQEELSALVASALSIPIDPPADWFNVPEASTPTALTVTDEGQVYGHLALWGIDHVGLAANGQSVHAPRSNTDYSYFHLGVVRTAEGTDVATGKITLDTKHAGRSWSGPRAAAHYEDTGSVVADVRATDGIHGIWLTGVLRPNVSPTQIRELRAAPLSGDWRDMGGNLELVAALAVNMPGFPVPRPGAMVASGSVKTLVAAGMIPPRRVRRPGTEGALSAKDLYYLKRLTAREERADLAAARVASAQKLARRVQVSQMARQVREAQ